MSFARSPKPPSEKLGLAPGTRLVVMGTAPAGAHGWPGLRVVSDADVVLVGCETEADVIAHAGRALDARREDGRLWLAYRLGNRALTRASLGNAVESLGLDLTWYRQISLDDGWSAVWFKRRSEFRSLNH